MVADEAPDLVTIREAAKMLGVHPSTLRNWDRAGKLKAVRVGSRRDRRFKKGEVLAEAQAQSSDDPISARDPKQAAGVVLQDSIRGASIAEILKQLGTTPAVLNDIVAQSQAAVEALEPFTVANKQLRDSIAHAVAVMDPMRGFENLFKESFKFPLGQLQAQVLDNMPDFRGLLEPILTEQNLLGERLHECIGSLFDAEAFSSGVYARLAATQAELFSTEAIATLAGSFKAAVIAGTSAPVWEQITANIGAYQDLTRAALWDLDAMGLADDKRLPFAEIKLAGGLLRSATTIVADLPAEADDARRATVKKPNLLHHFHRQVQELEATEELNDLELEAQVKDLRSFRAGNAGLWVVELWRHINRAAQLNGRAPIFEPSVDVVGVAARLPLSFAADETELGELIDGLYKLIFEASGDGRRVRVLAQPHEYETVQDIVVLRHYYRHDQTQGRSLHDSRRNFVRVGDVFERLIGKRLPSSPADWQRVCLGLMRRAEGFLRAIADRSEGQE
jgi:excisionase family DNA binding protein